MRWAMLRGREHQRIGSVELVAEESSAIALCRGGAAKTYSHTDPNEDAVLFANGEGGSLIAVTDGHGGDWGAERALDSLLEGVAETWTTAAPACAEPAQWCEAAHAAIEDANAAILAGAAELGLPAAPTTLSMALLRPAEGLLLHASVGDSHVFRARGERVEDIGWAALRRSRCFYLGYPPELGDREKARVACEDLAGTRALLLATDGVSERGIGLPDPAATIAQLLDSSAGRAAEQQPTEACRGLVEAALAAQRRQRAGDNVACAAWIRGL
ncbi:MAG: protein phosphatase 2C domain-containing protein [Deltaproteobacteria bacterium]|nr:protein phosphatase 2C domain-containing protein [Deltaproteobacteria bacterium]